MPDSSLNETLNVLEWTDVGLDVKFDFDKPLAMSKGDKPD